MMIDTTKPDEEFFTEYIQPLCAKHNIIRKGITVRDHFTNRIIDQIKVLDVPNIKQAMLEIPRLIRPRHKGDPREGVTSYGGKHVLERYRMYKYDIGKYISNGEFIVAMCLLGFAPKEWSTDINQLFVATYINRDCPEFDFEEFYTDFESKFVFLREPKYPQVYLSSIDLEIPKEIYSQYHEEIKTKALKRFTKHARVKHGKRICNRALMGVEYTGKFLPGYGNIQSPRPPPSVTDDHSYECFEVDGVDVDLI
jgi:hypothetical protein